MVSLVERKLMPSFRSTILTQGSGPALPRCRMNAWPSP